MLFLGRSEPKFAVSLLTCHFTMKERWIMCILCTPRPTYRSTYRSTVVRRIGRHIGRVSTDMSVDISVECRPICRPRCVARYISRASVDMSTDTRPICRLICRLRVVIRLSADMSIDRLPTFRRYFTATCVLVIVSNFCSADILDLLSASQRLLCINLASLSSVLHQHLVILRRPYPLSCQLYFVYLAVFHLSVLLDND